jgi:tetratricopeptide (TPR) repeat protein
MFGINLRSIVNESMKQYAFSAILLIVLFGCQNPNKEKDNGFSTSSAMCAPVTSDRAWYNSDNKAPLFEGLGDLHFPVSTKDSLVQKFMNQGIILAYGFNHAEAARSFYYASKLDSNCAMAFWGYAYVLGPNYNAGMESDNYERAYGAIQNALTLARKNTTEKERDLIKALSQRYAKEQVDDRSPLNQSYAMAMKLVYDKYPDDTDVGVLYAESLMNLHPWDLQDKEGNDKEWTPEIISILEKCIANNPQHPGAHHFYIHAVEASNKPERALESAKLFDEGLVPNAGHLVHMPSHVYIRTGDYHKGSLANIQALKVDSAYVTACNAQGTYPLAYYPHNQHFLAATATLEGNSKWALNAAEALQRKANKQLMKEPGWGTIQHYYTIPYYVYVKFGRWDEILAIQNELPDLDYPTAILHYAKGMSYLGKKNLRSAKTELTALEKIASKKALKEITIWEINSVFDLVQIAYKVLKAEILAQENKFTQSISLLKEAVAIEDGLNYNEPPDWFFSVRHNLGAIQLNAGQYLEAVNTYNQDLKNLPKNGWALKGLSVAYLKLGDLPSHNATESRFLESWSTSDIELKSSVLR